MFKKHASSVIYLEKDVDDESAAIGGIAKKIAKEVNGINHDKDTYKGKIDFEIASDDSSPILSFLLSEISPVPKRSLPSLLIGKIVTSSVCNKPTTLLAHMTSS